VEVMHILSGKQLVLEQLLGQPTQLLPLLFDAGQSDLFIYSHDMQRRLTFLSASTPNVCKIHLENWQGKSVLPLFTDHVWNERFKSEIVEELKPETVQHLNCEIWDENGNKAKLEVWRRLVFRDEVPIGVIGLARRVEDADPPHRTATPNPFEQLTTAELSVVTLVVKGALNKSIAFQLGIAMRTVEMRRSKAMKKLAIKSLSDLVRLWYQFQ